MQSNSRIRAVRANVAPTATPAITPGLKDGLAMRSVGGRRVSVKGGTACVRVDLIEELLLVGGQTLAEVPSLVTGDGLGSTEDDVKVLRGVSGSERIRLLSGASKVLGATEGSWGSRGFGVVVVTEGDSGPVSDTVC